MAIKLVTGLIAMFLMLAYVLAPAIKLKHPALAIVIAIGIVMMLVDLWQSLRERD